MSTKTFADFGITIPYNRDSGNVKVRCPRCDEQRSDKTDKSLSVNLDEGVWLCHYCGWHGSLGGRKPEGEPNGIYRTRRPAAPPKVYVKPEPLPEGGCSEGMVKWFTGRGISQATMERMHIAEARHRMQAGHDKEGHHHPEGIVNCILFPFYVDGELVNIKYRSGAKAFQLVAGARRVPFNIDAIKGEPACIIVEGEMDALSFVEAGWPNVISVPNGANSNLDWVDEFWETHFADKDMVFIAVDTDEKGIVLKNELLRRFGADKCRVVTYGEGCKDANELLMKGGADALRQALSNSPEIQMEGVFHTYDVAEAVNVIWQVGRSEGLRIGHKDFADICRFETGKMAVVTGKPASGKSEWIDEMAVHMNLLHGWKVAYFSPENLPIEEHVCKIIAKIAGKWCDIRCGLTGEELTQVAAHMEENFFFCDPADYKLSSVLDCFKFLVRRNGVRMVVLDPFNYLEDTSGSTSETQHINKMLDEIVKFSRRHGVLFIVMAHPRKPQANKDGTEARITMYDVSGSAHFYNKCDYGIILHKDKESGSVEVEVAKVRFSRLGRQGSAFFTYNTHNGRYIDKGGQENNTNMLNENDNGTRNN